MAAFFCRKCQLDYFSKEHQRHFPSEKCLHITVSKSLCTRTIPETIVLLYSTFGSLRYSRASRQLHWVKNISTRVVYDDSSLHAYLTKMCAYCCINWISKDPIYNLYYHTGANFQITSDLINQWGRVSRMFYVTKGLNIILQHAFFEKGQRLSSTEKCRQYLLSRWAVIISSQKSLKMIV